MKNLLTKAVDYFDTLENHIVTELIFQLQYQFFPKDAVIIKQREACDCIYIVLDGEVSVMIVNGFDTEVIEDLSKFSSFGAYTCMTKQRLSNSLVQAKSDCSILTLSIEIFKQMRNSDAQVDEIITNVENFLNEEGLPLCDFKVHRRKHNWSIKTIFKAAVNRVVKLNSRNNKGRALMNLIMHMKEKAIEDKVN